MNNVTGIILAAGKGTRMKSSKLKVLHDICGKPLIKYPVDSLKNNGIKKIYIVTGYKEEKIKEIFNKDKDIKFVRQKSLKGTADALKKVFDKNNIKYGTDIVLLYGDFPVIYPELIDKQIKYHKKQKADCTLAVLKTDKDKIKEYYSQHGKVERNKCGDILRILEKEEITPGSDLNEVNLGVYCFKYSEKFRKSLYSITPSKKGEIYFTHIFEKLAKYGLKISSFGYDSSLNVLGVNTQQDIAEAGKILRKKIACKLMDKGVSLVDPEAVYLENDIKVGKDTIIYPNVFIEEAVQIGCRCIIGPNSRIRKDTIIENDVEIGNFVEITRSRVKKNSKIKHFSYIGDCVVGEDVNIGAGTVTANYDGKNKNKTIIGKGSFIGSGTILIAPVKLGRKVITGAGSVITKNSTIPDGITIVGVPARCLKKKNFAVKNEAKKKS